MARQGGFLGTLGPVFLNETGSRQVGAAGVMINEVAATTTVATTQAAGVGVARGAVSALAAAFVQAAGIGLAQPGQITNQIRNPSFAGAVIGTPGTLPTNMVFAGSNLGVALNVTGFGSDGFGNYLEVRFVGTPTGSASYGIYLESNTQVAAVSGQTWASELAYRMVAGSTANLTTVLQVFGRNSSGSNLESGGALASPPTAVMQTANTTYRLTQALDAFVNTGFLFNYTLGNAVDLTLRLYGPLLVEPPATAGVSIVSGAAVATGVGRSVLAQGAVSLAQALAIGTAGNVMGQVTTAATPAVGTGVATGPSLTTIATASRAFGTGAVGNVFGQIQITGAQGVGVAAGQTAGVSILFGSAHAVGLAAAGTVVASPSPSPSQAAGTGTAQGGKPSATTTTTQANATGVGRAVGVHIVAKRRTITAVRVSTAT